MTYPVIAISNKFMQMYFSDSGPSTNQSIRYQWLHYSADYSSCFYYLLSVLAKQSRKATISLVVSLYIPPSVRLHATARIPPDRYSWNFIFWEFYKNLSAHSNFNL